MKGKRAFEKVTVAYILQVLWARDKSVGVIIANTFVTKLKIRCMGAITEFSLKKIVKCYKIIYCV